MLEGSGKKRIGSSEGDDTTTATPATSSSSSSPLPITSQIQTPGSPLVLNNKRKITKSASRLSALGVDQSGQTASLADSLHVLVADSRHNAVSPSGQSVVTNSSLDTMQTVRSQGSRQSAAVADVSSGLTEIEKEEVVRAFVKQFLEENPSAALDTSLMASLNAMTSNLVQQSFR